MIAVEKNSGDTTMAKREGKKQCPENAKYRRPPPVHPATRTPGHPGHPRNPQATRKSRKAQKKFPQGTKEIPTGTKE